MNQKGFIPIIFIIIIGVVAATSATFGVVKYKDEITANVSNVFKNIIDVSDTELRGKIKESGLSEESIIEEKSETEGKQDDAQKLQEQLRISEQKQLEAEKQLAEEKTKQAVEKAEAEADAFKKAQEEAQRQLEAKSIAEKQRQQEELQRQQEAQKLAEEQKARNDEIVQRYTKIFGLLKLFNKLEENYKEPLNQASGLYAEFLLKEYATKRLSVLDQVIPEIKAALRIPNLPYQFVSLSNELLDILTIKRENNLTFLSNTQDFSNYTPPAYNLPSYTPPIYNPPSYTPLYSLPPLSNYLPQNYSSIKTPQEIDYEIKVCNSIGWTYSLGLGCSP